MSKQIVCCAIPDCNKCAQARGWCYMHHNRWRRHGDPLFVKLYCGRDHRFIHLGAGTPEYIAWQSARNRCLNPKARNYHNYGGRGITFSDTWDKFECFIAELGSRPTPSHSLERVKNDRGYEPGNCIWATRQQQVRNRRNTVMVKIEGVTKPRAAWCEEFSIKLRVVEDRVRRGWDQVTAITTPQTRFYL